MRNRNQVVIPLDLGILIAEKAPVRKLIEICDELDYTDLYAAYLRHWRKIDPRTMFELLVFAYMNGIYSSREIESSCRNDIRFMWILQNEPAPDHSTIARFQNERLTGVMEDLFYQLTEKLYEMGELSYKNMFVDGTKIEAMPTDTPLCGQKQWQSGWRNWKYALQRKYRKWLCGISFLWILLLKTVFLA